MIDLIFKTFGLAALVFVWGFAWSWAKDKEEKAIEAAHGIGCETTLVKGEA